MAGFPNPSAVASIIVPGEGDPAEALRNGTYSMTWAGQIVKKFREAKIPHLSDTNLALPTLYLHFLDGDFRDSGATIRRYDQQSPLDNSLRSGNDMSEVIVKLPSVYTSTDFVDRCAQEDSEIKEHVAAVIKSLQSQGEIWVSGSEERNGNADPRALFFSLKTARPKAGVSLDKKAFGIPEEAQQYLFVNNHSSVLYFDEHVKEAFNMCIEKLPEVGQAFPPAEKLAVFLKVFYEGGFGYNKKIPCGPTSYLPVNIGTAAMSVVPAFTGQVGIATGYPYRLPAPFLPFTETVPISIDAIRSMSEYHGRYGMAFTRLVFVWEGDLWATNNTLDFCSLLPHGGFFYVPESMRDHQAKGGLVYAFGESTSDAPELSIG